MTQSVVAGAVISLRRYRPEEWATASPCAAATREDTYVDGVRLALGIVAAALTAAVAGVIMGEYELRGVLPYVAGLLFGLAVAEAAITAGADRAWALAVPSALFAFLGLAWAAKIDAGGGIGRVAGARWISSCIAAAAALWWIRQFGGRSTSSPEPTTPE